MICATTRISGASWFPCCGTNALAGCSATASRQTAPTCARNARPAALRASVKRPQCPRLYRDQARIVAVERRSQPASERSFMDHEHSYRSLIGRKGARVGLPVPGSLNRAMPGCPGRRNASARATSCARRVRPDHMPLQRLPGKEPTGGWDTPPRRPSAATAARASFPRLTWHGPPDPKSHQLGPPLLCIASAR
jgi:hypothetical protein